MLVGCSKESSYLDGSFGHFKLLTVSYGSFEYTQHMFWLSNLIMLSYL